MSSAYRLESSSSVMIWDNLGFVMEAAMTPPCSLISFSALRSLIGSVSDVQGTEKITYRDVAFAEGSDEARPFLAAFSAESM